jgi:hypothetical protein
LPLVITMACLCMQYLTAPSILHFFLLWNTNLVLHTQIVINNWFHYIFTRSPARTTNEDRTTNDSLLLKSCWVEGPSKKFCLHQQLHEMCYAKNFINPKRAIYLQASETFRHITSYLCGMSHIFRHITSYKLRTFV